VSDKRLRGTRLGSTSFETEEGVDFVSTQDITFRTDAGEEFTVTFMEGIDLPFEWTSPHSSVKGRRVLPNGKTVDGVDPNAPTPPAPSVTHWEQLLKRRTIEELEVILAERRAEMRAAGHFNSKAA
jgi:hypothetical protein